MRTTMLNAEQVLALGRFCERYGFESFARKPDRKLIWVPAGKRIGYWKFYRV